MLSYRFLETSHLKLDRYIRTTRRRILIHAVRAPPTLRPAPLCEMWTPLEFQYTITNCRVEKKKYRFVVNHDELKKFLKKYVNIIIKIILGNILIRYLLGDSPELILHVYGKVIKVRYIFFFFLTLDYYNSKARSEHTKFHVMMAKYSLDNLKYNYLFTTACTDVFIKRAFFFFQQKYTISPLGVIRIWAIGSFHIYEG